MKKRVLIAVLGLALAVGLTGCNLKQDIIKQIYGEVSGANEPKPAECVSEGLFYHDMLSAEEQVIYDEMLDCIMNFKEESIPLHCLESESIEKCYNAIMDDHGGIYWVSNAGYSYRQETSPIEFTFTPTYAMTLDEKNELDAAMRKELARYSKAIAKCDNDYDKAKKAYEMLVNRVSYSDESENNQDIRSIFIDKASVCAGYSKAAQMLLSEAGIQCGIVHGTTLDGVAHSWDIIRLDGEYYYYDPTWGDPTYNNSASQMDICYDYLNVTDDDISYSRVIESEFKLPKCKKMDCNYYVKSGLYFEKWDKEAICDAIKLAYKRGDKSIAIRFSAGIFVSQAMEYLIDEQGVYSLCEGMDSVAYSTDTDLCVMTLIFNGQ